MLSCEYLETQSIRIKGRCVFMSSFIKGELMIIFSYFFMMFLYARIPTYFVLWSMALFSIGLSLPSFLCWLSEATILIKMLRVFLMRLLSISANILLLLVMRKTLFTKLNSTLLTPELNLSIVIPYFYA